MDARRARRANRQALESHRIMKAAAAATARAATAHVSTIQVNET